MRGELAVRLLDPYQIQENVRKLLKGQYILIGLNIVKFKFLSLKRRIVILNLIQHSWKCVKNSPYPSQNISPFRLLIYRNKETLHCHN